MKQFCLEYTDSDEFGDRLRELKNQTADFPELMFQIFSEVLEPAAVNKVCGEIERIFPEAPYMGCSTSGNIVNCSLSSNITVICTAFEKSTTKFKIFQYDRSKYSTAGITSAITEETKRNPWVKAVEMYFTIPKGSFTEFCDGLGNVAEDVQLFGGVACSDDITSDASCVFTRSDGYSRTSIVAVMYGGEDFYVDSIKITGWKPLRRIFRVTRSEGSRLYELDGIPAYEVYRRYLGIDNNDNFFYNTLEFPLFYEHNNTTILRVPVSCNEDGSLNMSSDIDQGSIVRISYGDPRTVIQTIEEDSRRFREFQPDALHIFSCAARRAFWNTNEPTYELSPFKDISSSTGFFSHGEFVRASGFLNQHNVTLVIAAMREGEKKAVMPSEETKETTLSLSKIPLVSRMATFIGESSRELEEINSRLENANNKLKAAVIIDGLTGLYNRKEIQSRIESQLKNVNNETFSLIMLDIDNFKQVNDTYGHQEGDTVIIALANILKSENLQYSENFSAGRWGGEEFMLLLPDTKLSVATLIAELVRKYFANTTFHTVRPQTVSIGVTQAKPEDTIDSLCTRVDTALYKAKKNGKNQVVAD